MAHYPLLHPDTYARQQDHHAAAAAAGMERAACTQCNQHADSAHAPVAHFACGHVMHLACLLSYVKAPDAQAIARNQCWRCLCDEISPDRTAADLDNAHRRVSRLQSAKAQAHQEYTRWTRLQDKLLDDTPASKRRDAPATGGALPLRTVAKLIGESSEFRCGNMLLTLSPVEVAERIADNGLSAHEMLVDGSPDVRVTLKQMRLELQFDWACLTGPLQLTVEHLYVPPRAPATPPPHLLHNTLSALIMLFRPTMQQLIDIGLTAKYIARTKPRAVALAAVGFDMDAFIQQFGAARARRLFNEMAAPDAWTLDDWIGHFGLQREHFARLNIRTPQDTAYDHNELRTLFGADVLSV